MVRIVHISDTHNRLGDIEVPDGDILVHSGDACCNQTAEEYAHFNEDLARLPHKHRLIIGGNHDPEDEDLCREILTAGTYLLDSGVTIEGIKFWGAPWQPGSGFNFNSFTLEPGSPELAHHWGLIPPDTDVLITHTPPAGILDRCDYGKNIGCHVLQRCLTYGAQPRVHLFGHAHSSNGTYLDPDTGTLYSNAAITDENDEATQPAHVFDL